ncbi:MAG: hypothetical protein IE909_01885 [Campylobacterales bacterium]|nr:hypothetical protein [Campylobacterales bacterium]
MENSLPIHDIKPFVQIPDYSMYLFYLIICVGSLVLGLGLLYLYKYFKHKNNSKEQEYKALLQNLDYNDSKTSAYTISKYGRLLAKSERSIRLIEQLHKELEPFKYKKNIPTPLPKNIIVAVERFLESLDV